jgi:hypothetical protein
MLHTLPAAHLGQLAPPQSMSVSVPFFALSVHAGAWQKPPVQTPLWQSAATPHTLPAVHFVQLPPQSMSVSVAFLTPSAHVAPWHLSGLPEQTALWQSLAPVQVAPVEHLGHEAPPQSVSVSVPFFTKSVQLAA